MQMEHFVQKISRLLGQIEAQAFKQEGFSDLTMRQLLYLETIAQMQNPTFSQLADELEVTPPTVSVLVNKLIDLGYITKSRSEQDGRVYHLQLTPTGKHMARLHDQIHRWLAKRITRNLDEREVQQLGEILEKVDL
jgi:DNA-binding MarR family transcriptional regulator